MPEHAWWTRQVPWPSFWTRAACIGQGGTQIRLFLLSVMIVFVGVSGRALAATYDDNHLDGDDYQCTAGVRGSGEYASMPCQFAFIVPAERGEDN